VSSAPVAPSWELLTAVRDRLGIIRTANGYRTDVGELVHIEEAHLERIATPQIVLIASDFDTVEEGRSHRRIAVNFVIGAIVPATRADAQAIAHAAIADIADALSPRQRGYGLPEGCAGIEIGDRNILQRPDGAPLIVAQVSARAVLTEKPNARD
jgi:hypothetical protein